MKGHASVWIVTTLLLTVAGGGCEKKPEQKPQPTGLAAQFDGTVTDMRVTSAATEAANRVIRSAMDCEAVKASLDDAHAKLDLALKEVKTVPGRASLQALRQEVDRVASACP